ncbi:MAG: HEAT repeat domain-containing protein [Planctomycetota bacterium JB042]
MKQQTKRICDLLTSDRGDVQCAAVLVLGELGADEEGVVDALGELLAGRDRSLMTYALEALEKIGDARALDHVTPLLRRDDELQEGAVRVLAGLGNGVAKKLGERLVEAGAPERRAIQRAWTRIGTVAATKLLLESLARESPGDVEDALLGVRREVTAMTDRSRRATTENLRKFLSGPDARRSKEARAAALRILGFVDDPSAFVVLLRNARASAPPVVRTAALRALRTAPRPARGGEAAARQLLEALGDPDYEHVVRPALDVLLPMTLAPSMVDDLDALTRSRHADVRRFALSKLGTFDSKEAVEVLLRFVDEPDPAVREPAARALSALTAARATVLSRLLSETRGERAWMLARVLRPQAEELSTDQVRRLGERVVRHLDHDNRLYEPLLFLLRHASAKACREVLLRRALRKKRSRRFEDTALTLRLLERHEIFDVEVRYELAIALLKQSPRGAARADDPVVELFSGIVSQDFPLFERLRKETVLTADELAWLGAHFVSREHDEQQLGGQVLHLVMRKAPRSNLAKDARSMLAQHGVA